MKKVTIKDSEVGTCRIMLEIDNDGNIDILYVEKID
jgi:hypothetical protein